MRKHRPPTASANLREILDYFGKCPECGYPATAFTTPRDAGAVYASCDRPCGWTGVVPLTTMTKHRRPAEID
ncbi:putative RNA-binding Zn-ribbon protein involved in translation (DUF1610 family) [Nocardia transvalensis]|uniref:Putative RNA-binding Zn-ribbon protein involved in translation (DUF1610 family) n=1 Tax=Nocardia transvalensis TaxID=37333 RepID=A0A7W9PBV6_9NOCA|nr:hypothetical protein [Nocardia transvalensis]MBB5912868.1 putative RNA-binding Zn-ribbon protein involved in translation (DUF1610 family) [Nocardia transvalensis]